MTSSKLKCDSEKFQAILRSGLDNYLYWLRHVYWNKLLQPVPAKRNKMAWIEDVPAMSFFIIGDINRPSIAVATGPVDWRMMLTGNR